MNRAGSPPSKTSDWRSNNKLVRRSTDGGISWEFVARVNPERYERSEPDHDDEMTAHKGDDRQDGITHSQSASTREAGTVCRP